jgi:hypothetical protein
VLKFRLQNGIAKIISLLISDLEFIIQEISLKIVNVDRSVMYMVMSVQPTVQQFSSILNIHGMREIE